MDFTVRSQLTVIQLFTFRVLIMGNIVMLVLKSVTCTVDLDSQTLFELDQFLSSLKAGPH